MGHQATPHARSRWPFGQRHAYPHGMGPSRDSRPGIREIFLDIAASCDRLEAPLYADLARCVADWADEPPLSSLLAPYADARVADMIPLRLLSAVHRLALAREAPEIGIYLPTTGGTPPRDEADVERLRRAFLATIDSHRDAVAEALTQVPQTNEVGRTVGLAALLRRVAQGFGLPVRLHEIGCSAGLSLRVDGLIAEAVVAEDHTAWGALPGIVERVGCDLAPVDATSTDGRLTLTSFIWPDHAARFERLRGALDVANGIDVSLVTADAGFADARRLVNTQGLGIVLMRPWRESRKAYVELTRSLLASFDLGRVAGCIVTVTPETIRVHDTRK